MTAPTANPPTVNGAESQPPVDADSVGSQFAHEYYTFLNKEPSRLHLFYNKNSVLSHGYQGNDVDVCRGQQAIREKVVQLDFEDCKVLVQNIDSQNSINGGIVIQVLGQMSNRGGIAQQFVQTFFLAEQPKGYYVLNDIFRFLKDDIVEDEEEEVAEEASTEPPSEQPVATMETKAETAPIKAVPAHEPVPALEPTVAQVPTKAVTQEKHQAHASAPPAAVDDKKTADKKADKKADRKSEAKETKRTEAKKEAEPVDNVTEPVKAEAASAPTPAPVAAAAPVEDASTVPAGPPKPKTWANLAAVNSNHWGAQASATKGASVPAPQPAAPKAQTKPHTAGQSQGQGQQVKTPGTRANGREEYHSIYIKNVTERMSLDMLRESFSKFGKVTHLEYTHKRNCAFLDFSTPDAMNAALKQNTVPVGNEIVLAEERRRGSNNSFNNNNNNTNPNGPQTGGRFHNNASNSNANGHGQQTQGGHRGARPNNARGGPGGPSDRTKQPQHKPEKAAQPTLVK